MEELGMGFRHISNGAGGYAEEQSYTTVCICRKPCADFDTATCQPKPHADWGIVVIAAVFYMSLIGYCLGVHRKALRWAKKRGWR